MINVVVVFVCWSCKFCLYFRLLKLFNLSSLFNMSWTDSEIESLITFYSSVLVSGDRNFATGVKNRRQKRTPVFCRRFLERVSLALHTRGGSTSVISRLTYSIRPHHIAQRCVVIKRHELCISSQLGGTARGALNPAQPPLTADKNKRRLNNNRN